MASAVFRGVTVVYAGFFRRTLGLIIDGIFVGIISGILMFLGVNVVALSVLLGFLYQPFFESSALQGTPGKYIMGMRVTDLTGARITFKMAFIRYLVRFISGALLFIGYFMNLFTAKRQTLHDLAAGTLVIDGAVPNGHVIEAWYEEFSSVLGMADRNREESAGPSPAWNSTSTSSSASQSTVKTATPADLAGLYDLYQKGILTEAEYNEKRAEILKKL